MPARGWLPGHNLPVEHCAHRQQGKEHQRDQEAMLPHIQLPVRQLELPAVVAVVVRVRPGLDIDAVHLQQTRPSDAQQAACRSAADLGGASYKPCYCSKCRGRAEAGSRPIGLHTSKLLEVPLKAMGPPKMCL